MESMDTSMDSRGTSDADDEEVSISLLFYLEMTALI
ncbi:hypothetical protein T03_9134 [Trichinella britovi]|uniref:Uncharacterized protein n=1 Tax=Trichinella britovi TaxID=45882 RepID=A0A0V1CFW2_TRIBR|nr:hypothetical protein T03_9134 [Trichinella britovi]